MAEIDASQQNQPVTPATPPPAGDGIDEISSGFEKKKPGLLVRLFRQLLIFFVLAYLVLFAGYYYISLQKDDLQQRAAFYAKKYEIDTLLFHALITQESHWNPWAYSSAGAAGLTQLMPETAKSVCGLSTKERFQSEKNLDCGAKYFAQQLRRFKSVKLALAAYNAGPTRVAKLGRIPRIPETQHYVKRVFTHWQQAQKQQAAP